MWIWHKADRLRHLGFVLNLRGAMGEILVKIHLFILLVVELCFYDALNSQAICVAFYSECEKSDKFRSEALISAWGSFTCVKSTTRNPRFTFLPKEVILRIFTLWKNPSIPGGSIGLLFSEIWFFKLILIFKFQNIPCALGFEVKHSKFFCISFRAYIIILRMVFTINK